jgi:Tol biopolymer transport system component
MPRNWLEVAALASVACSGDAVTSAPAAGSSAPAAGGAQIVYECVVDGNHDLCVVPAGGGAERRLTDHPADDMWPRFSPDGLTVLFSSERSGRFQLWEVPLGGGAARRVRDSPAREWQSDPSPDGRRVAFLSDAGGEESLRVARRASTEDQASTLGRLVLSHGRRTVLGNPHWSRDGLRLAFSSNAGHAGHHVYVVPAAGGGAQRVSPLLSGACEPRFSPDGRKVAYVRRRHLTRERSEIVEQDLDTGRVRVLVDWPALNYDPVYSPDGAEIAFVSTVAAPKEDVHAVYRQRLSDGRAWRVTFRHAARHPDYEPRGRRAVQGPAAEAQEVLGSVPAMKASMRTPGVPARPGRPISSTGRNTTLPGME